MVRSNNIRIKRSPVFSDILSRSPSDAILGAGGSESKIYSYSLAVNPTLQYPSLAVDARSGRGLKCENSRLSDYGSSYGMY